MKPSRILSLLFLLTLLSCPAHAQWRSSDSLRIVRLLEEAGSLKQKPENWMLWFGKKFAGIPYVAGTLDRNDEERLVVNTRQMDCSTFVETVTALTLCAHNGETAFADFCRRLTDVRYADGQVAYTSRNHYFTRWAEANGCKGFVKDICPSPPFTARQTVDVYWMSTHVAHYRMLTAHPEWLQPVKDMERSISGRQYRYIPKDAIKDNALFRATIHDGDIIAIITNKKGLDTTHLGIALWHSDGLHLLNASSIHKKVVDEPMLLARYMRRHPSQAGIRVCRVTGAETK